MTDGSVCQTEGFQAVSRFLRPFRNLRNFLVYKYNVVVYPLIS
jgi:hypothetical protein